MTRPLSPMLIKFSIHVGIGARLTHVVFEVFGKLTGKNTGSALSKYGVKIACG